MYLDKDGREIYENLEDVENTYKIGLKKKILKSY